MTKDQVIEEFEEVWESIITLHYWLNSVLIKDEAWEEYTRYLCNQKKITRRQFYSWENPFL